MTTIAVQDKSKVYNYSGLDDHAQPVKVWREHKAVVAHIGKPEFDNFFRNEFVPVTFMLDNGQLFKNSIFHGRQYEALVANGTLVEGKTVTVKYDDMGWIKDINGQRWN